MERKIHTTKITPTGITTHKPKKLVPNYNELDVEEIEED